MARRSNNRHRGGRQRGEAKEVQFFDCAVCKAKGLTKRKTKQVLDPDGNKVRICKHHPVPARPVVFVYDRDKAKAEQTEIRRKTRATS